LASVLTSAVAAISGVIGLLIYVEVYAALNLANVPAGAQGILLVVPVVLAAVIVLGIISGFFALRG